MILELEHSKTLIEEDLSSKLNLNLKVYNNKYQVFLCFWKYSTTKSKLLPHFKYQTKIPLSLIYFQAWIQMIEVIFKPYIEYELFLQLMIVILTAWNV